MDSKSLGESPKYFRTPMNAYIGNVREIGRNNNLEIDQRGPMPTLPCKADIRQHDGHRASRVRRNSRLDE